MGVGLVDNVGLLVLLEVVSWLRDTSLGRFDLRGWDGDCGAWSLLGGRLARYERLQDSCSQCNCW